MRLARRLCSDSASTCGAGRRCCSRRSTAFTRTRPRCLASAQLGVRSGRSDHRSAYGLAAEGSVALGQSSRPRSVSWLRPKPPAPAVADTTAKSERDRWENDNDHRVLLEHARRWGPSDVGRVSRIRDSASGGAGGAHASAFLTAARLLHFGRIPDPLSACKFGSSLGGGGRQAHTGGERSCTCHREQHNAAHLRFHEGVTGVGGRAMARARSGPTRSSEGIDWRSGGGGGEHVMWSQR